MTLNASLRRHDQAGERLMMKCHQYCGRCHRFNTSTELWTIPVVRGKRQLLLSREA